MATGIQEKIDRLGEYFIGFNIGSTKEGQQIVYLEVSFPQGWGISNLLKDKFGVTATKGNRQGSYYLFAPLLDSGIDSVFDAAEFNIKANEETQEKKNFLAEKIAELQKIVTEEDMATLRTLEFKYKKKQTAAKGVKPKKEENNEETTDDNDMA